MATHSWAIFDLDGTLADDTHRVALALAKDWDAYHAASANDPLHLAVALILRSWFFNSGKIAIFTGRTEPYRAMTRMWLRTHHLPHDVLLMRQESDRRPATQTKLEMFNDFMRGRAPTEVAFVVEDRDALVAMWRGLGLTCLQPRPGAY